GAGSGCGPGHWMLGGASPPRRLQGAAVTAVTRPDVTPTDVTLAERAAGRAADAAQDAVALIAQGRLPEAVDLLDEVRRHVVNAQARLVPDECDTLCRLFLSPRSGSPATRRHASPKTTSTPTTTRSRSSGAVTTGGPSCATGSASART